MMTKRYRKEIGGIVLLLSFCLVSIVIVNILFLRETQNPIADSVTVDENRFAEGYIEVHVRPRFVDLEQEYVTVGLEFVPHGRFDGGDGLLSMPVEVIVSSVAHDDLHFQPGRRMFPIEVNLDFYEGEVGNYPFDEHRALLEVLVVEQTNVEGVWRSLPTQIAFEGDHHSYHFTDLPLPPSEHGYLGFDIHLKRSPLVIGTAIFLIVTIWGLMIVNIMLFVGVWRDYVKADFSLFGYMSGFIVAMFFFRSMFPDIPSFLGVLSDYLALFWSIVVAAAIAIVVGVKWLVGIFQDEDQQPNSIA